MKLWLDTESVGLMGNTKLIQFAINDGPVQFIKFFRDGYDGDTLTLLVNLLERPSTTLVAFHASHDLAHLYRIMHGYCFGFRLDSRERPVQPFACKVLDLQIPAMLKSPLAPWAFAKGAARSIATVRKVPVCAAKLVEERVYAAIRARIPSEIELHCSHKQVKERRDLINLAFWCDGRASLKGLMRTYGIPTIPIEDVWPLPPKGSERPWLPYPDPAVHDPVEAQCDEIMRNPNAPFYRYAELDIHYLRVLYDRLGRPEPDHHSACTHVNAYTRYHGFGLDRLVLDRTIAHYQSKVEAAQRALSGCDLASAKQRLALLQRHDPLVQSSKREVLEALAASDRPSKPVALAMLDYNRYQQRLIQAQKIAESRTGRAHPVLKVMGTRTGRSAGAEGLNWQGIAQAERTPAGLVGVRAALQTAAGGDFAAFEVTIAAPAYKDAQLQSDLDEGIDLHSMVAATAHPAAIRRGLAYDQFRALYKAHDDWARGVRLDCKRVLFGLFYGAQPPKIAQVLRITEEEATVVRNRIFARYEGIGRFMMEMQRRFCTADTDKWRRESVRAMDATMTDLTGFTASWQFEREVAILLWEMGSDGLATGQAGSVTRQPDKGPQSIDQAVRSALLGSAIAIQAAVSRQAGNSVIQGSGANLAKMLQAELWETLRLPSLLIHDELQVPRYAGFDYEQFDVKCALWVKAHKKLVPSLAFDRAKTERWSDK